MSTARDVKDDFSFTKDSLALSDALQWLKRAKDAGLVDVSDEFLSQLTEYRNVCSAQVAKKPFRWD